MHRAVKNMFGEEIEIGEKRMYSSNVWPRVPETDEQGDQMSLLKDRPKFGPTRFIKKIWNLTMQI
jgi:hypothetical protein